MKIPSEVLRTLPLSLSAVGFSSNKQRHFFAANLYLLIYHFLFIMFVWSYFQILLTHPGSPADCKVRGAKASPSQESIQSLENSQATGVDEGARLIHNFSNDGEKDGVIRDLPTPSEPSLSEQQQSPIFPVGSPSTSSNFMELDTRQRIIPMENVDVSVTVKRNGDQRYCTKCNFEKVTGRLCVF